MIRLDTALLVQRFSTGAGDGVRALALMGSHARGDATPYSDIDLVRFVDRPPRDPVLELDEGRLLVVSEVGPADVERWFAAPEKATVCIAGVRAAVALWDPAGWLEAIRARALSFTWDDRLQRAADEYASRMLAGLAEEVLKGLQGLRVGDVGRLLNAAFGLSWHLCAAVRVQQGILVRGDNTSVLDVIEAVGRESRWSTLARQAFGIESDDRAGAGARLAQQVEAGLGLYKETAAFLGPAIAAADRPIVDRALSLIREGGIRTTGRGARTEPAHDE